MHGGPFAELVHGFTQRPSSPWDQVAILALFGLFKLTGHTYSYISTMMMTLSPCLSHSSHAVRPCRCVIFKPADIFFDLQLAELARQTCTGPRDQLSAEQSATRWACCCASCGHGHPQVHAPQPVWLRALQGSKALASPCMTLLVMSCCVTAGGPCQQAQRGSERRASGRPGSLVRSTSTGPGYSIRRPQGPQ